MSKFQVVYIPIGVPTFHMESAAEQFKKSVEMLKLISPDVVFPDAPLLSVDDLAAFCGKINPDLIILQNLTFANSAYAAEVAGKFSCPLLLWTLREPVIDGGRLRLNSLTGAYSAGNVLHSLGRGNFEYIFGAPDEDAVDAKISAAIAAARTVKSLASLNIAAIGYPPQGFEFGTVPSAELQRIFGVKARYIEVRELLNKAKSYSEQERGEILNEVSAKFVGLENTGRQNLLDFAGLYKAYRDFITENNIKAVASRCWPDLFVEYGTPVCAVLGLLNDEKIAASCEADLYGALSMYIGVELSGKPVFFGDPVSLDEKANTVTFWHCGMAACSLAREDTGCQSGVHCNRKIGPTMEFGCKPAPYVTIFRIGRNADGSVRFFIASGEAPDVPKQFNGVSMVVKTDANAAELVNSTVRGGWDPHFAVIYGDVAEELTCLANMLNAEMEGF